MNAVHHHDDDDLEDGFDDDIYIPPPTVSTPKQLTREPLFQTLFRQSIDESDAVLRDFADYVVGPLSELFALKSAKGGDFFRQKAADGAPNAMRYSRDQTLRGHLINGMLPALQIARLLVRWGAKHLRDWDARAERLFIAGYMLHDFLKIDAVQEELKAAGFTDYFAMSSPSAAQIPVLEDIFFRWGSLLGLDAFLETAGGLAASLHHVIFIACNTQVYSGTLNNPRMLPNISRMDEPLVTAARGVSNLADLLAYVAPTPREMVADAGIRKLIMGSLDGGNGRVLAVARLTYHHVAENRGLLLNLIHNTTLEALSIPDVRVPLLYAPSGVVYLERHDAPAMPTPDALAQTIVNNIRRTAGLKLIETGKGAKRGNTFLQIDDSYNDFFSMPEMIHAAPKLIARYITNNKSPERLENARARGATDIPTVSIDAKDARADQISEWASLIERLYRDRMGQDVSMTILNLLGISDLAVIFSTVRQTVGAAGGLPLAWYWAGGHALSRRAGLDDLETLAWLADISAQLAATLPDELPDAARANQNTWDDLGDYVGRVLTLGGEKGLTGLRDELQGYMRAKGRGGTVCAICGSDYATRKPKESAISFQPGVYTGRLPISKGDNTRPLCSVCALEQLLRQLFMENLSTGSKAEGQRIRYLSFYPSYYFTPETLRLMQRAAGRIRDVRISDKELMAQLRDADLTDPVFWQRLEAFLMPQLDEPSKRVLRYQKETQATFLTFGVRAYDATETESWVQPVFLALVLSVCLDVKIVASDSSVPMLLESAELPETLWFDGAHPAIQAIIGGSRLRNDDIRMALARLVAAYMIHLDTEYAPPKENWNRFGPIAHSLMESPLYVFHHLKRQQRDDRPPSAAQVSRYIHFAETLFTVNDRGIQQMNHARELVKRYRGFYRAKNYRNANSVLRPLTVAAEALLVADLRLYPDVESLKDLVCGALAKFMERVSRGQADGRFPAGISPSERDIAMNEFSRYFVEELFVGLFKQDVSALRGQQLNLFRDTCEAIYRKMQVEEWAERGRDSDDDADDGE